MIQIGGLQKTTLIDYPGELACIVFLVGCNFRCPFCYSKELVEPTEDDFLLEEEVFFDFLKKRKGQLDACVICGGEPTLNPDLYEFCVKIKKLGYKIKLDTNGSNFKMLKKLIDDQLVDYVAMDVKAPFEKYKKVVGKEVDLEQIKSSIALLKEGRISYEFRTTVVPVLHTLLDIKKIAKQIAPADKYFIQNFRNDKELLDIRFRNVEAFDELELQEVINEIKTLFGICYLR